MIIAETKQDVKHKWHFTSDSTSQGVAYDAEQRHASKGFVPEALHSKVVSLTYMDGQTISS